MSNTNDHSPEKILADADSSMLASAFAYIDEDEAGKATQFEEILVGSPEARSQYIAFCLQSTMLSEELLRQQAGRLFSSPEDGDVVGMDGMHGSVLESTDLRLGSLGEERRLPESELQKKRSVLPENLGFSLRSIAKAHAVRVQLSVAVLMLVSFSIWLGVRSVRVSPLATVEPISADALWSSSNGKQHRPLSLATNESLNLTEGTLRLVTNEGVSLHLEAPCELTVLGVQKLLVSQGKVAAWVPAKATGFTIDTPVVRIVDLGTQFGAEVDEDGSTVVEVYLGRVELLRRISSDSFAERGVVQKAGARAEIRSSPTNGSLSLNTIANFDQRVKWRNGELAWQAASLALNPVAYCDFREESGHLTSVVNDKVEEAFIDKDVSLVQEGPWGSRVSSGAALFAPSGGQVELPFGLASIRQTASYTIAIWVKPEQLGNQNILLGSNLRGADTEYGPRLSLASDGSFQHYVYCPASEPRTEGRKYYQRSKTRYSPGSWSFVVISAESHGMMRLYVNGVLESEEHINHDLKKDYPRLLLGVRSGYSSNPGRRVHHLCGALAGLFVYDRCLDSEEVSQLFYRAGFVQ